VQFRLSISVEPEEVFLLKFPASTRFALKSPDVDSIVKPSLACILTLYLPEEVLKTVFSVTASVPVTSPDVLVQLKFFTVSSSNRISAGRLANVIHLERFLADINPF
jgi:hypothetical protein